MTHGPGLLELLDPSTRHRQLEHGATSYPIGQNLYVVP
jgi:hypothetical protein